MLCSGRELLLNDDHDGIIELPADATVGEPAAKALGLNDAVIDVRSRPIAATAPASMALHAISPRRAWAACAKAIFRRCRGASASPIKTGLDFPAVRKMQRQCSQAASFAA
jgi:phenylalanyl-tRNA synthetase beta chain